MGGVMRWQLNHTYISPACKTQELRSQGVMLPKDAHPPLTGTYENIAMQSSVQSHSAL